MIFSSMIITGPLRRCVDRAGGFMVHSCRAFAVADGAVAVAAAAAAAAAVPANT